MPGCPWPKQCFVNLILTCGSVFCGPTSPPPKSTQRVACASRVARAWRSADVSQRKVLIAEFGTLITRIYSAAIDAYDGHETQVDPVRLAPGDDDVIVRSRFKKAGAEPVEVNYFMWKSAQGWEVYDIVVEGVSLVITYRSQFGEEVARSGIDGLIRILAEKNRAPKR